MTDEACTIKFTPMSDLKDQERPQDVVFPVPECLGMLRGGGSVSFGKYVFYKKSRGLYFIYPGISTPKQVYYRNIKSFLDSLKDNLTQIGGQDISLFDGYSEVVDMLKNYVPEMSSLDLVSAASIPNFGIF